MTEGTCVRREPLFCWPQRPGLFLKAVSYDLTLGHVHSCLEKGQRALLWVILSPGESRGHVFELGFVDGPRLLRFFIRLEHTLYIFVGGALHKRRARGTEQGYRFWVLLSKQKMFVSKITNASKMMNDSHLFSCSVLWLHNELHFWEGVE